MTLSWLKWEEEVQSLERFRQLISNTNPKILAVKDVTNARVVASVKAQTLVSEDGLTTVDDLRNALQSQTCTAVDPEDLWALGKEFDYGVEITWSGSGAC